MRRADPLDALFDSRSGSLASAAFRGYIGHSLLFYRQNNLRSFAEFLRIGRGLDAGPGPSPRAGRAPAPEGAGWAAALSAVSQDGERRALAGLARAIRANPREPAFLILRGFLRGEDHWGSRRLPEASISDFEKALAFDPDSPWARMGLGMALEMRRRFVRARAQFEAAARLAPAWSWPHVFRGVCLWYQADFSGAIAAFGRAAELDPQGEYPLLFAARAKADVRDRTMTADLDRALKRAPDSGFALSWRGRAMFVRTRLPEALADLRRACEVLPDYDRGWSWLGVSLLEVGKVREAVPHLLKARALNPHYPTTLYPLAGALLKLGRRREAAKIMREAAFLDRTGVWVEHRISMSHPNPAALRSRADLDVLLASSPRAAWAWAWRGQTELLLQNYGRALSDLEKALALAPDDAWALLWRAETLRRLGEREAALAGAEAALRRDRSLSWAHAVRADCLLALGRPAAALAAVERSLALQDFCGPAHALRGRVLLALGRGADAVAPLERALEHHPQDSWVRRLLDEARGVARSPAAAPEAAFETGRLAEDAAALGLRAAARALRRGDGTAALAACAEDRRRESRFYRLRGWLKLTAGDAAGAAEDASRALDDALDPTDAASLWLRERARRALGAA